MTPKNAIIGCKLDKCPRAAKSEAANSLDTVRFAPEGAYLQFEVAFWGHFGPVSQAALEAHFRAPKRARKGSKTAQTAQNRASEAFWGPSGDPEIRTRATFPK